MTSLPEQGDQTIHYRAWVAFTAATGRDLQTQARERIGMVVPPESFLNCVPGVRVTPGAPTHTRYRVGRASSYERRRHQIANPAKPDPIKRREEGPGTAAAAAVTMTSSRLKKAGSFGTRISGRWTPSMR